MKDIYLSTAYLAPVEYYTKFLEYDNVFIEQNDNYVKQTYRNRCVIASASGSLSLTIPTEKSDSPKQLVKDVRISDHGNWRHQHWNALVAGYRNSPFFEYYQDDFAKFYENKYEFLIDFNEQLQNLVCSLIDIEPKFRRTEFYKEQFKENEYDYREIINPKHDFKLLDESFTPKPYYQVFKDKHGFISNLSIADLLFNMGPESLLILRDSIVGK